MAVKHRPSHTPLQVHYRQSRPAVSKASVIGIAGALAAVAAVAWQGPSLAALVPTPAPTVTVTTTLTPSEPPTGPGTATPVPPTSTPEPAVEEGHDFTFMSKIGDEPVSWGCEMPILVATNGDVPEGAQDALGLVVETLRQASGLPLQITGPDHVADITVYYVAPGTTREHITLGNGDNLGKAGPVSRNGRITSGVALIRNDLALTDPNTPDGVAVLMHELAHTLGLSHADQSTEELMTPNHEPGDEPVLGPGDKAGLELLGCP